MNNNGESISIPDQDYFLFLAWIITHEKGHLDLSVANNYNWDGESQLGKSHDSYLNKLYKNESKYKKKLGIPVFLVEMRNRLYYGKDGGKEELLWYDYESVK